MKISELAALTDVSTDTIRYYEKIGLLPAAHRDTNNYRMYTQEHVRYLKFVKNCRQLDMTQEEIQRLLALTTAPNEPCHEINALLDEHIKHVQNKIAELKQAEIMLLQVREQCQLPTEVRRCGILEGLEQIEGWPKFNHATC